MTVKMFFIWRGQKYKEYRYMQKIGIPYLIPVSFFFDRIGELKNYRYL